VIKELERGRLPKVITKGLIRRSQEDQRRRRRCDCRGGGVTAEQR
jgi:hypothetical protein